MPRTFHLFVGYLHIFINSEDLTDYFEYVGINVLACDIVHTFGFVGPSTIHSISAHIQVDSKDKDKVMQPVFWESGLIIRPRRQLRHNNVSSSANEWSV